ncbi:unnamed protein product, partial [Mesorhabditis belari]|uniref:Uncharacterized protein n=1 Tax=Mesorhabditis belari TaxID=2138241 RepID=A0AAF3FQQ1_9BILA
MAFDHCMRDISLFRPGLCKTTLPGLYKTLDKVKKAILGKNDEIITMLKIGLSFHENSRTARALSAATFTAEGAVETVSQRQVPAIFGKSRYTPLHEQNVPPPQPPVDPNTLFMACCEQRGLPDASRAMSALRT